MVFNTNKTFLLNLNIYRILTEEKEVKIHKGWFSHIMTLYSFLFCFVQKQTTSCSVFLRRHLRLATPPKTGP